MEPIIHEIGAGFITILLGIVGWLITRSAGHITDSIKDANAGMKELGVKLDGVVTRVHGQDVVLARLDERVENLENETPSTKVLNG